MAGHVTIEYCVVWNYYPRAAGLAAEIQQRFGIEPDLVKGRGGVFEVILGDEVLFSKKQAGRFPEPGEVARQLEQRLST